MFILWSVLLGIGLAIDAFCVSVTNTIKNEIKKKYMILIALTYGLFQGIMPTIGYIFSYNLSNFRIFVKIVPLLGFVILLWLGIKSLLEAKNKEEDNNESKLNIKIILLQALATSIDALSCGIGLDNTIGSNKLIHIIICISFIIIITFVICLIGLFIGKKLKDKYLTKSQIIGGIILIIIALKILIEFIIEMI